jgi:hypothetical protein
MSILWPYKFLQLFMWMLHDHSLFFGFIQFSNCSCECYMIILWLYQVLKLFIWMLHDNYLTLSSSRIVYVNVTWWLFYDFIKFSNCYVNVTWLFYDFIKFSNGLCECYIWQFFGFIKFSNCLCECYMTILWLYQVLKLFMWMLHDYSMTLSSSQIVMWLLHMIIL